MISLRIERDGGRVRSPSMRRVHGYVPTHLVMSRMVRPRRTGSRAPERRSSWSCQSRRGRTSGASRSGPPAAAVVVQPRNPAVGRAAGDRCASAYGWARHTNRWRCTVCAIAGPWHWCHTVGRCWSSDPVHVTVDCHQAELLRPGGIGWTLEMEQSLRRPGKPRRDRTVGSGARVSRGR
jgi:hypothetical protein